MMNRSQRDLDLVIETRSENYDRNDARWMAQVQELYKDLQREVGNIHKQVTPQEGIKGGVETIILELVSAGVITAAVEIFKAWVAQDRSRSLKLSITREGKLQEFEISGKGMRSSVIQEFMNAALGRVGGAE